jgi:hypothetical protein
MGRPTSLRERNNVECPSCGSILTRSRGGGRDIYEQRIRRRLCMDCDLFFSTVEVPILYADGKPVPFSALVPDNLIANRRNQRRRVGYHSMASGRHPYVKPARVRVSVAVQPPVRADGAGPWSDELEEARLRADMHRRFQREEESLSA